METCNQAKYGVNHKINNGNCDNDIDTNKSDRNGFGHYWNQIKALNSERQIQWIAWNRFIL